MILAAYLYVKKPVLYISTRKTAERVSNILLNIIIDTELAFLNDGSDDAASFQAAERRAKAITNTANFLISDASRTYDLHWASIDRHLKHAQKYMRSRSAIEAIIIDEKIRPGSIPTVIRSARMLSIDIHCPEGFVVHDGDESHIWNNKWNDTNKSLR
jgi:hypothetical protein